MGRERLPHDFFHHELRAWQNKSDIYHRAQVVCFSGGLTSFLTLTMPYSRKYHHYFTDEKNEAQGQHSSKVFKSVNDES